MTVCEYRPGLEGIPATQSSISFVDGKQGILEYRGINITELAYQSTFLETSYLLIWGSLPTKEELADFEYEIRYHRRLKYRIRDMMKCFPESGHPMDALQACAAALGLFYSRRALDDPAYIRAATVRLLAKIPTMVAAFQLMRKGNDPVQPRDDLDYSANFLYMLSEREPDPLAAQIFDNGDCLNAHRSLCSGCFSSRNLSRTAARRSQ
jgi:citrate synthase